uniref:Methyl-CpG-binding domain-containing protein 9 isoform X3 n=1 Tax=Rhizophora mucronata TaxID=61149 RepID=A0A2P2IJT3_RHIMU
MQHFGTFTIHNFNRIKVPLQG